MPVVYKTPTVLNFHLILVLELDTHKNFYSCSPKEVVHLGLVWISRLTQENLSTAEGGKCLWRKQKSSALWRHWGRWWARADGEDTSGGKASGAFLPSAMCFPDRRYLLLLLTHTYLLKAETVCAESCF